MPSSIRVVNDGCGHPVTPHRNQLAYEASCQHREQQQCICDGKVRGIDYCIIASQLNNLAVTLYERREYSTAAELFQDAMKAAVADVGPNNNASSSANDNNTETSRPSTPDLAEKKRLILKRIQWDEQLRFATATDTPAETQRNEKADTYVDGGSACDGGPVFIFKALKLSSTNLLSREINSVVILHNTALIHLKNESWEVSQKLVDMAMEVVTGQTEQMTAAGVNLTGLFNNCGCLKYRSGKHNEAVRYFDQALTIGKGLVDRALPNGATARCDNAYRDVGIVQSNLGRTYYATKDDKAFHHCNEAFEIKRDLYGETSAEVVVNMYNMGRLYQAHKKNNEASECFVPIFAYFKSRSQEQWDLPLQDAVSILTHVISVFAKTSSFALNGFYINQSLKKLNTLRFQYGFDHPDLPTYLNRIGDALTEAGEPELALPFFLEQLRVEKVFLMHNNLEFAITLNHIGQAYLQCGNHDLAMANFGKALTLVNDQMQNIHRLSEPSVVAIILYNIATVHFSLGHFNKSMDVFEQATTMLREIVGDIHPEIVDMRYKIGTIQIGIGRVGPAIKNFEEAYRVSQRVYGRDDLRVAKIIFNLAKINELKGEYDMALRNFQETLRIETFNLTRNHIDVAVTLFSIGQLHHARGDLQEAMDVYGEVLRITQSKADSRYYHFVASVMSMIGNIYLELGLIDEGNSILQQAITISPGIMLVGPGEQGNNNGSDISFHLNYVALACSPPAAAAA